MTETCVTSSFIAYLVVIDMSVAWHHLETDPLCITCTQQNGQSKIKTNWILHTSNVNSHDFGTLRLSQIVGRIDHG